MRAGWRQIPLAALCTFERGLTYSKSDEVESSTNIVLRAGNIDLLNARLNLTDLRYVSDRIIVPHTKKVREGSLLICTASGSRSHLGKVALVDGQYDMAFGGFMGQITPNAQVTPRYLYRVLTSSAYNRHLSGLTGGTNINNLKFDDIANFLVLVPALAEQQRIVAILDEAFEAIATATSNAEKNLANAETLRRGSAISLLSSTGKNWRSKPLGDLCELYQPHTISKADMTETGPYPVFGANGYIGQYHSFNHDKSQLLVTCRGATCGSINMSHPKSWVTGNSMVVCPRSEEISVRYLKLVLENAFDFRTVITGSAQPQITRQSLAPAIVRFPRERSEQDRVSGVLEEISVEIGRLNNLYRDKLGAVAGLKQSLLARAFAGELTASDALAP